MGTLFDSTLNNRLRFCKEALKLDNPWQNGFKQASQAPIFCLFLLTCWISIKDSYGNSIYATSILNRPSILSVDMHSSLSYCLKILPGKYSLNCEIYSSKQRWGLNGTQISTNSSIICAVCYKAPSTYVDDMQHYFENKPGIEIVGLRLNHLLQADDLVLMSQTGTGLQRLLDKLAKYCHMWHLILNLIKTKIMAFNKKFQISDPTTIFTFKGGVIEE